MSTEWLTRQFDELTPHELYAILKLRSEVFVVEQQCIFLDMDDKDQQSAHLMGWQGDHLAAYTRLVPVGISYPDYPSIGRVVTSMQARGTGVGKKLMEISIAQIESLFGHQPIKIGAQLYLKKFYESLGFAQAGAEYDEDGIPHIPMIKPAS